MDFLKYMKYLSLLPLLRSVIDFIKEAEQIYKGPGNGAHKLQLVVSKLVPLVRAAADAGLISTKLADAIVNGAPALVSVIVQIMNFVGALNDKPTTEPAPPVRAFAYYTFLDERPSRSELQVGDRIYQSSSTQQYFVIPNGGMGTPAADLVLVETVSQ